MHYKDNYQQVIDQAVYKEPPPPMVPEIVYAEQFSKDYSAMAFIRWENGMVSAFGADGLQITHLRGRYEDVRNDVLNVALACPGEVRFYRRYDDPRRLIEHVSNPREW